jgi:hypothetical protein
MVEEIHGQFDTETSSMLVGCDPSTPITDHQILKQELDMIEKFRKAIPIRNLGYLLFLLVILFSPASAFCMEGNPDEKSETMRPALIKDKGDDGVLIDGRQYRIAESTIILDLLGKKILLCDLPIPCEALVEYRMINGLNPVCLRIEVKRLLEDSKDSS